MSTDSKQPNTSLVVSSLMSDEFKQSIASVLPRHLTAERMTKIALNAVRKNPKLSLCTKASFTDCMMQLSQWGLEPDGRRAHLIPFENRRAGTVECTLILDYKGVAELVLRSGLVSRIHSDVVCENDEFVEDKGEILHHRPNRKGDRGKPYAVYCLVVMKDGASQSRVMSVSEINEIRDHSQGYKSAVQYKKDHPWISFWDEMAKKTVFKNLSKWLPWSADIREAVDYGDDDERVVEGKVTSRLEMSSSEVTAMLASANTPEQEPEPRTEIETTATTEMPVVAGTGPGQKMASGEVPLTHDDAIKSYNRCKTRADYITFQKRLTNYTMTDQEAMELDLMCAQKIDDLKGDESDFKLQQG